MKKITLVLLFLTIISCSNNKENKIEKTEIKKEVITEIDFVKTFEGKIDNKYEYLIKIISNNGVITGKYFYKNNCKNISVRGKVEKNSKVTIKEFGDGLENEPTGYFVGNVVNNHKIVGNWKKEKQSKSIPFYFIETNESYDSSLSNCKTQKREKLLETLVLDEIELVDFPETKDGSRSWDNPMGSFKPDIYIKILDNNKKEVFNNQNNDYHNKDKNDLPLFFKFKNGLKIEKGKYENGIIIQIMDVDLSTDDDKMGMIKFERKGNHYSSIKHIQSFENKEIKIKITSHFEK